MSLGAAWAALSWSAAAAIAWIAVGVLFLGCVIGIVISREPKPRNRRKSP